MKNSVNNKPESLSFYRINSSENKTYESAMYQFLEQNDAATRTRPRPSRVMVGAITSGPMYRSSIPTIPLIPITISNSEATITAPCICNSCQPLEVDKMMRYIRAGDIHIRRVIHICLVFASLIFLPLSTPSTITS